MTTPCDRLSSMYMKDTVFVIIVIYTQGFFFTCNERCTRLKLRDQVFDKKLVLPFYLYPLLLSGGFYFILPSYGVLLILREE